MLNLKVITEYINSYLLELGFIINSYLLELGFIINSEATKQAKEEKKWRLLLYKG